MQFSKQRCGLPALSCEADLVLQHAVIKAVSSRQYDNWHAAGWYSRLETGQHSVCKTMRTCRCCAAQGFGLCCTRLASTG
jgi:hypothetical protein